MSDENGILTVEERRKRIAEIERHVFHEMKESMKRLLELRQERIGGNIESVPATERGSSIGVATGHPVADLARTH
jgi:hypothetical protein